VSTNAVPAAADETRFRRAYGPWALVTGASDGIGQAMARRLAGAGLNLVLVARRQEALARFAAELTTGYGIEARPVAADLADPAGVAAVDEQTRDLDIGLLVAAAGFGSSGPLLDGRLDDELAMIDVNCRAVLAQCVQFGRRFAQRGGGGIVLMGSIVGFQGVPFAANYAATKAYVQSLAEALHVELAPLNVAVVASAPGPVRSGFAARAGMRMGQTLTPDQVARDTLAALGRRAIARPGGLSKLLGWSLAALPRPARVRAMGRIMGGMAATGDGPPGAHPAG
jgi:hypothetical protein